MYLLSLNKILFLYISSIERWVLLEGLRRSLYTNQYKPSKLNYKHLNNCIGGNRVN